MRKKIESIIKYAYNNSPFYKKKYSFISDDILNGEINIGNIPTIEKKEIIDCDINLLSEKYYKDYVEHNLLKFYTSGSTGLCLQIYWGKKEYNFSLLELWFLRKKYYNIGPNEKCCMFYLNNREGFDEPKKIQSDNLLAFSKNNLDDNRICDIYHEIELFRPKYLIVEPTIALLFARCKKKYDLKDIDSIQYIELTGEYLYNEVRVEIEQCFKCATANQYGAYEVNSIAYECPFGNMHCMSNNVYVEILDETGKSVSDGVIGDIYVTSLTNKVMPFVRYKIGDRGKICTDINCKCGNSSPILKLINARNNDYISCEDGSYIHYSVFVKAVENTNRVMCNQILQFQIQQIEFRYFIINFVLSSEDVDKEKLVRTFCQFIEEERLQKSKLEFRFSDNLFPETDTGKFKFFIGLKK